MSTTNINRRRDNLAKHHNAVADMIIDQINAGTAPWQQEWDPKKAGFTLPHNPVTGRVFSGGNALFGLLIMTKLATNDSRFLTYKQAESKGWQVRKGSHGYSFTVYKTFRRKDENGEPATASDGTPLFGRYLSTFTVFHASQIDGIPALDVNDTPAWESSTSIDDLLEAAGVTIVHGGAPAFYPTLDHITMPARSAYETAEGYYGSLLHEVTHWTGGSQRLDRLQSTEFGSVEYAREELTADIGALLLAARFGVGYSPASTAAYVESWAKFADGDLRSLVTKAVAEASRAVDFMAGFASAGEVSAAA